MDRPCQLMTDQSGVADASVDEGLARAMMSVPGCARERARLTDAA